MRIYGRNAVQATFKVRPHDIVRLYLVQKEKKKFSHVMKFMAAQKLAYHLVSEAELDKIAESDRHGGVCLITRRPAIMKIPEWLKLMSSRSKVLCLCLENVENPHNLGAIMRAAAHFGVSGLLTNRPDMVLTGSAFRVAEGGGEYLSIVDTSNTDTLIGLLKKNHYTTLATSSHTSDLSLYALAQKPKLSTKLALFLGEERTGLRTQTLKDADIRLTIPGTNQVESLNVAASAAILLSHLFPLIQ